jgi:hypothetical protein
MPAVQAARSVRTQLLLVTPQRMQTRGYEKRASTKQLNLSGVRKEIDSVDGLDLIDCLKNTHSPLYNTNAQYTLDEFMNNLRPDITNNPMSAMLCPQLRSLISNSENLPQIIRFKTVRHAQLLVMNDSKAVHNASCERWDGLGPALVSIPEQAAQMEGPRQH